MDVDDVEEGVGLKFRVLGAQHPNFQLPVLFESLLVERTRLLPVG